MRVFLVAGLCALATAAAGAETKPLKGAPAPVAKVAVGKPAVVKTAAVNDGPSKRVLAQREAMKALAFLDGEWRGASKLKRKEGWVNQTQTERAGLMLDGTVRMIEGRAFDADGKTTYNAVSIISYDPSALAYTLRTYSASGYANDYPLTVTASGYRWEVKSGGKTSVRHEVVVKAGIWTETATRMPADGEPETYLQFAVRRLGDKAWPAAGAVASR